MNFLNNLNAQIVRTKKRQKEYDEKIQEIRKRQAEKTQSLLSEQEQTGELPLL